MTVEGGCVHAVFCDRSKNELARLNEESACCRLAELAALLRMSAAITIGLHHTFGLNLTTKNAAVARKALLLLKRRAAASARRSRCAAPVS